MEQEAKNRHGWTKTCASRGGDGDERGLLWARGALDAEESVEAQ